MCLEDKIITLLEGMDGYVFTANEREWCELLDISIVESNKIIKAIKNIKFFRTCTLYCEGDGLISARLVDMPDGNDL